MNHSRLQPKTRLLRTQVIWKDNDNDYDHMDDEYCPISLDLCRKKRFIFSVFLALVVIAAQQEIMPLLSLATMIGGGEQQEVANSIVDTTARSTQIQHDESVTNSQHAATLFHQKVGESSSLGGDANLLESPLNANNDTNSLQLAPSESYSMGPMHNTKEVPLPTVLEKNLADVDEPFRYGEDIPYFFHTPRSMGQTAKEILGTCVGINMNHTTFNTTDSIGRAKEMKLLEKENVKIIVTQYLHEGATLFSENHRGR